MGGISLARASLVSMTVQSLLFGVYVTLFARTQRIILARGEDGRLSFNKLLWAASIFMLIISIAHISIDAARIQIAFLGFPNDEEGTDAFLGSLNGGTYMAKSALYTVQTYLGDACIIYRAYMVYGCRLWVVAVPMVLLLGVTVAGSGLLYSFAHSQPGTVVFDFADWAVPYVGGTLLTNLICTILIVNRIVRMSPRTMGRRELVGFTPIRVLMESGVIYTASVGCLTALCASRSNAYTIILDLLCPNIGITFSLIIVQVHHERRKSPAVIDLSNMGSSQCNTQDSNNRAGAGGNRSKGFSALDIHIEPDASANEDGRAMALRGHKYRDSQDEVFIGSYP